MTAIAKNFGSGGGNLACGGSAGNPSLAATLRDIAADLADLAGAAPVGGSAVSAPALNAFTDPPSAAEMALLRTLVNQLRTAVIEARQTQTDRSGVDLRTVAV
jgi:hypothetical protein